MSPDWRTIRPPVQPVEVMYADQAGWVGAGHVYMIRQETVHRYAAFLPWMVPSLVHVFWGSQALDNVKNATPTFYLHWNASQYAMTRDDMAHLHIVRMLSGRNVRDVVTLKGKTSFTMKPGFRPQDEVAFDSQFFGESLLQIRIKIPLRDGQYMIFLNDAAGDGFEFGVSCGRS